MEKHVTSTGVILLSTFVSKQKTVSATLTVAELSWEDVIAVKTVERRSETIPLSEVIGVRLGRAGRSGKWLDDVDNATCFSLWSVERQRHKWRERCATFQSGDPPQIRLWVNTIRELVHKAGLKRPCSLLIFINPIAGCKKGGQIYRDLVGPLFMLARIKCDVITTQQQNEAFDTILNYDLSSVDGIVSVGGDGMYSEVLHGVMRRCLRDQGLDDSPGPHDNLTVPHWRIGIIPAGSTDSLSYSIQGCNDPKTSALHIIIGDDMALDVAAIHHGNTFLKYNSTLMGYGYYGDCIQDGETNRWMGPKRYHWSGFKKVLSNTSYEGEISFLPCTSMDNFPRDGKTCQAGCSVCRLSLPDLTSKAGQCHDDMQAADGWRTVRGRFVAINAFLVSCRCSLSMPGPAPSAHLGDGCADLVLVRQCRRVDYIRHLHRCTRRTADQFDFPFVEVYRVKAFRFTSPVSEADRGNAVTRGAVQRPHTALPTSVWNCDGEVVTDISLSYRVHHQKIRLFARGPEEEADQPNKSRTCFRDYCDTDTCCSSRMSRYRTFDNRPLDD